MPVTVNRLSAAVTLLLAVFCTLCLLAPPAEALEANPKGYEVPDLSGFVPSKKYHYDVSKSLKGMETYVELFEFSGNTKIRRFSVEGIIYGYTVQSEDAPGYLILDEFGQGLFTARYGLDEAFDVPGWLVQRLLQ